ncbi:MAG: glycosyl hydrolase family 76 [Bacteroidales bacterium]|jgi:predicted alpha-1,6-mannanase (GH76 family)|nr:glycosyl hydrolase family 76 [Bacteroidales bacterium]
MKKHWMFLLLVLFFSAGILAACGDNRKDPPDAGEIETLSVNWADAADSSSRTLIFRFWNNSENYFNTDNAGDKSFQYWPNAHALDVITDACLRSGDSFYKDYFDRWFEGVRRKNGNTWYNVFYDDMEWIALAMLRAYNATDDGKWLAACREVWQDIKTGWNERGGGGIAWKKDQLWSKNACSNGPPAILAARLYRQFGDEEDKEWAEKIYAWLRETLFMPGVGSVADNLNTETGVINSSWIFTYNQGTFLGAALELYEITGEKIYINDAVKAADYTINALVNANDALLKSEGTGDGGLFKGIFVRYFAQLILSDGITEATRKKYLTFLKHNGETLWKQGTDKQWVLFAPYWKDKPGTTTGLTEQLSGCMLMEALAMLDREGLLK